MTNQQSSEWQPFLCKFVTRRPLALIRLAAHEHSALLSTRRGMSEFTLNIPHDYLRGVVAPCMCLITGMQLEIQGQETVQEVTYVGVIRSKQPTATLDTRIKVERTSRVVPSASHLAGAIEELRLGQLFAARLVENAPVSRLSPKLSAAIVDTLAKNYCNHGPLRTLVAGLERPSTDSSERLQGDAIEMALKVFGLPGDAPAAHLELVKGKKSQLAGARIMEDAVIEHDARSVPEYNLVGSNATGRATFRKGLQTLEVITANRRKLEEVFGVDLIYINHFHGNLVMVQYKMLEPDDRAGGNDWIYRQDRHLSKQLGAMQRFDSRSDKVGQYRLSSDFFYFKFVRRYGTSDASFLIPLGHFRELANRAGRPSRSKKLRLSYEALDGRYMRQTAFYSLLQSGYIGADVAMTEALQLLINDLLLGGDALVVAIQRETSYQEKDRDRTQLLSNGIDAVSH